jgi:Fe2+ or Zn2+ uptake regulation protein
LTSTREKRLALIYEMVKKRHPERLPAEDVYHALALDGVSRATIKGYLETLRDSGQVDYYREDRSPEVKEEITKIERPQSNNRKYNPR